MAMRTFLLLLVATACNAAVTQPDQIQVAPGFRVELLREAGPKEGSWICMTQDDKGRLYISPQNAIPESGFAKDSKWGGIWRVTLRDGSTENAKDTEDVTAKGAKDAKENKSGENKSGAQPGEILNPKSEILNWEKVPIPVGDAMGMLWAFDSLYVSGQGPQGRGIYRCKSGNGDDQIDTATLFKAIPDGNGEHGAHAILLGPDKKSLYIINGNSTPILDGLAPDSPYRNWGEDDLLPRLKDPVATFFDKIKAPYGCVYRTDADGTRWELFAGGLRNPYDLAFNPDGELFTYDSDMEWDRGLPWYRPTRILHIVPGGEYGFREGSAKWPAWQPDSLPAVCDIGLGCPTGIAFYPGSLDVGTCAKGWPEKYRRALFMLDWTFGRILAVTLYQKGASYTATNDLASTTYPRDAEVDPKGDVEVFLSGKGMPVTDMEFLKDGSMVFTTGGRGTASGLYRVSWVGKDVQRASGDASGRAGFQPAAPGILPGATNVAGSTIHDTRTATEARIAPSDNERRSTPDGPGRIPGPAGGTPALPARPRLADADATRNTARTTDAPEVQRKLAGGAASEASATTGSPSAKTSAPAGALETDRRTPADFRAQVSSRHPDSFSLRYGARFYRHPARMNLENMEAFDINQQILDELERDSIPGSTDKDVASMAMGILNNDGDKQSREAVERLFRRGGSDAEDLLRWVRGFAEGVTDDIPAADRNDIKALSGILAESDVRYFARGLLTESLSLARVGGPAHQTTVFEVSKKVSSLKLPLDAFMFRVELRKRKANGEVLLFELPDDLKLLKLRALELSFARQGRPSAEVVKALVEELSKEYPHGPPPVPAATPPDGAAALQNDAAEKVGAARGSDVAGGDVRRSMLNRELSQLLIWLTNPELGELNSELAAKAAAPEAKTKSPGPAPIAAPKNDDLLFTGIPPRPLGPVPNPGASVFPGRKGDAALAAAGREVIQKTLALMDAAPSQEEQIWYALALRWAHGWSPGQRVRYFRWFHEKAARYTGGNSFAKFVEAIRADAASRVPASLREAPQAGVTDPEYAALAQWLRPVAAPTPAAALKPRAFVKAWTLPDIETALDALKDRQPDLARGRDIYTQAQCAQCHLFRDAGGNVGPDLTAVAQRFGRHDILESITDPSKVVSDQYAMVMLTVLDGQGGTREVNGLVKEETSATITILTDPLAGKTSNLYKNVVTKREKAAVSTMPPGLLYTLTAEEVADLLAFFGAK